MSNALAVATVTETLRQMLEAAVSADIPGAIATAVRPVHSGPAGGPPKLGVNVFLYQVTPNVAWRNMDLPNRNNNAQLTNRPRAALDLHYLLSFYGDDKQLEPQRLLGRTIQRLHSTPVLARPAIENAILAQPFLASSDLSKEVELVKFTPSPLSLDELSKLWSVFFQTTYALSVAYEASVVLIEADETPVKALPVKERLLYVAPFRNPVVSRVTSVAGEDLPITQGSTLRIRGEQLRADVTRVSFGSVQVTPAAPDISVTNITLPLPGSLKAGVHGLQVVQPMLMGNPPVEHKAVESNVFPFVLQPVISGISATSTGVTLTVGPAIGNTQRVVLLLNQDVPVTPSSYAFAPEVGSVQGANVTIPINGVKPGSYFVRLQVDGATSSVDLDPASVNFGPKVSIP